MCVAIEYSTGQNFPCLLVLVLYSGLGIFGCGLSLVEMLLRSNLQVLVILTTSEGLKF